MDFKRLLHVNAGGNVIPYESGILFEDMRMQVMLFMDTCKFDQVRETIIKELGWNDLSDEVMLEGRFDADTYHSYTCMVPIKGDVDWVTYMTIMGQSTMKILVVVVAKVSHICSKEDHINLEQACLDRLGFGSSECRGDRCGPSQPAQPCTEDHINLNKLILFDPVLDLVTTKDIDVVVSQPTQAHNEYQDQTYLNEVPLVVPFFKSSFGEQGDQGSVQAIEEETKISSFVEVAQLLVDRCRSTPKNGFDQRA